jgi:hypothetical protein
MNYQIKTSPEVFGEKYFKSSNYADYMERGPRYAQMAREIAFALSAVGIINKNTKIIDFGCAVGFLVKAFREIRLDCDGHDTSMWARKEARKLGIRFVDNGSYDLMIALDVFEHMDDASILESLATFSADFILVRIPCALKPGGDFHLKISRDDPTHINCKTRQEWIRFFNLKRFLPLNLCTIYDSPGVMAGIFL